MRIIHYEISGPCTPSENAGNNSSKQLCKREHRTLLELNQDIEPLATTGVERVLHQKIPKQRKK